MKTESQFDGRCPECGEKEGLMGKSGGGGRTLIICTGCGWKGQEDDLVDDDGGVIITP